MKSLLLLLLLSGCAVIRNPPAASTPVREARYYRTRYVPNFALGMGCDLAATALLRGVGTVVAPVRKADAPIGRMAICITGAVVQRSVDKGYRESGGLFVISGAWLMEMLRHIF
jgi:hypothetical protein